MTHPAKPAVLAYDGSESAATAIAVTGQLLPVGFDAEGLSEQATGPAWSAILDSADQHDCAAIVIGSRGLTGLSAALGSVSNRVVHHSRRPVLVVPPEEER